ncbi:uncharacterized protein ACMZJ9_022002 [Mantella aurantiaca]
MPLLHPSGRVTPPIRKKDSAQDTKRETTAPHRRKRDSTHYQEEERLHPGGRETPPRRKRDHPGGRETPPRIQRGKPLLHPGGRETPPTTRRKRDSTQEEERLHPGGREIPPMTKRDSAQDTKREATAPPKRKRDSTHEEVGLCPGYKEERRKRDSTQEEETPPRRKRDSTQEEERRLCSTQVGGRIHPDERTSSPRKVNFAPPRRDIAPPTLTTGTKMSSCLEKVIEKLTAYKEGALTGTAEMRPASTQQGEGPDSTKNPHAPPEGKIKAGSCEEGDLSDTCSSMARTMAYVKREPFLYEGLSLGATMHHTLHPSVHIKEEHRLYNDRNFADLFTPMEYIQYRSVHIKEEPREAGEYLNMEAPAYCSARREDGRLAQSSVFSALPMSYPQHSDCGKAFTPRSHFLSHQRAHPGEKPFSCLDCGRCFSQRSYFMSHQKIHSGEHPFHCFQCGKTFRIKSSLSKHLRTHQMENPFTCPLCHKSFMHRGHFLAHQRLHDEEEKFSCPLCGKSFIHHGHFLAHQRSHAEESRFSCPHCHKSFIHRGHFSAHLRVHTGEKPFVCPDCSSSFSTHHNLVVHQRLHAGPSITYL